MYKVMIIDDEINIIEGIKYMLTKLLPDCCVCGVAFNGYEGIEIAKSIRPDIIITDIRMPGMDGLTMLQEIKYLDLKARIIVLSGYTEFEYAKKAINLGVEDYITKPVDEQEFYEVLTHVCLTLDNHRMLHNKVKSLECTYDLYCNHMMDYIIKDIIDNVQSSPITDTQLENIEALGFPSDIGEFLCTTIEIIEGHNLSDNLTENIEMTLLDLLRFNTFVYIIKYNENMLVVLTAERKQIDKKKIVSTLESVMLQFKDVCIRDNMKINIGIGNITNSIKHVGRSFSESRIALNYKMIKGSGKVLDFAKISVDGSGKLLITEKEFENLEKCIETFNIDDATIIIEKIFERISYNNEISLEQLQLQSLNIILSGIRKMSYMQVHLNEFLGKNILSLESISDFRNLNQLKNWIINTIKAIIELMVLQNKPIEKQLIDEIKEYILLNVEDKVTLVNVAEHFYINPYYLSQLFKKKTGVTFQRYIMDIRMMRAKIYFDETNLKVYEVCYKVGYTDVSHFSKTFGKYFGMKPSEYIRNRSN